MSAFRLFILVIAAIAAIILAFVVRGAMAPKTAEPTTVAEGGAAAPAPVAKVLVARRDLPVGARLAAADMGWQEWPASALNPAYITDGAPPAAPVKGASEAARKAAEAAANTLFGGSAIQSLTGSVVREPILSGEPILTRKIVRAGEGNYMAIMLTPGMRAMSLPVSVDTAAGGFIMPGDRVDVLLSRDGGGDRGVVTQTVLRNLRVLAIDQADAPAKDAKTMIGAVATLEVPAGDSETMAMAQAQAKAGGALVLALRSYADAGAAGSRGAAASGSGRTIRVFRAGKASEVTVSR